VEYLQAIAVAFDDDRIADNAMTLLEDLDAQERVVIQQAVDLSADADSTTSRHQRNARRANGQASPQRVAQPAASARLSATMIRAAVLTGVRCEKACGKLPRDACRYRRRTPR
jgi:hypothetical protein